MNHLTTLYVNQADREREIGQGLRNRQILQHDNETPADVVRPVPTTVTPRRATIIPVRARAAGR